MENLSPHFYHMCLKGKISYEKCDAPPPTYDTFADSDLSSCSVGSSISPEAHSCDELVSQSWFAIQKWCYYATKQSVKPPDEEAFLQDAVGLQYSSEHHCPETSWGGGSWHAGSRSTQCESPLEMRNINVTGRLLLVKTGIDINVKEKTASRKKRQYEKKTLTSAERDCSAPLFAQVRIDISQTSGHESLTLMSYSQESKIC